MTKMCEEKKNEIVCFVEKNYDDAHSEEVKGYVNSRIGKDTFPSVSSSNIQYYLDYVKSTKVIEPFDLVDKYDELETATEAATGMLQALPQAPPQHDV